MRLASQSPRAECVCRTEEAPMSKIAVEFHISGMTQELYDKVIVDFEAKDKEMAAEGQAATEGRVCHVAMPEEGGWFVFDVWESAEAFGRMGETLMPILAQHGVEMPEPNIYPVHNIQ
jgi:hypothetical protein